MTPEEVRAIIAEHHQVPVDYQSAPVILREDVVLPAVTVDNYVSITGLGFQATPGLIYHFRFWFMFLLGPAIETFPDVLANEGMALTVLGPTFTDANYGTQYNGTYLAHAATYYGQIIGQGNGGWDAFTSMGQNGIFLTGVFSPATIEGAVVVSEQGMVVARIKHLGNDPWDITIKRGAFCEWWAVPL